MKPQNIFFYLSYFIFQISILFSKPHISVVTYSYCRISRYCTVTLLKRFIHDCTSTNHHIIAKSYLAKHFDTWPNPNIISNYRNRAFFDILSNVHTLVNITPFSNSCQRMHYNQTIVIYFQPPRNSCMELKTPILILAAYVAISKKVQPICSFEYFYKIHPSSKRFQISILHLR